MPGVQPEVSNGPEVLVSRLTSEPLCVYVSFCILNILKPNLLFWRGKKLRKKIGNVDFLNIWFGH